MNNVEHDALPKQLENNQIEISPKKEIRNWCLIVGSLIVITSTFFTFAADAGLGRMVGMRMRLLDYPAVMIPIGLAAANIVFALCRARIPTYIISVLILIFAGLSISMAGTIYKYGRYGEGYYILILGVVIMVASFPIHIALKKKKRE